MLNASYLYVDSHVKVYNSSRLVPELWNSQRRMPLPGIMQYFVNDLHGRPLLVVTEEVRGNLAKSLPAVIAAVRQVVGDRRFTVIFDRGGYDGQLFKWLLRAGLHHLPAWRCAPSGRAVRTSGSPLGRPTRALPPGGRCRQSG